MNTLSKTARAVLESELLKIEQSLIIAHVQADRVQWLETQRDQLRKDLGILVPEATFNNVFCAECNERLSEEESELGAVKHARCVS